MDSTGTLSAPTSSAPRRIVLDDRTAIIGGRILLALCVAVALVLLRNVAVEQDSTLSRRIAYLGLNSYALFLVHFSLCLLGNALFVRMGWHSPAEGVAMLLLIWLASNLLADQFYRHVEQPAGALAWRWPLRAAPSDIS